MLIRSLSALVLVFSLFGCSEKAVTKTTDKEAKSASALVSFLEDSDKPAVIKFYADWCTSCKAYAPAFEMVKSELSGSTDFYSIDVDEASYKALVRELKIARIPETVFVSADRKNVFKQLGPIRPNILKQLIGKLKAS